MGESLVIVQFLLTRSQRSQKPLRYHAPRALQTHFSVRWDRCWLEGSPWRVAAQCGCSKCTFAHTSLGSYLRAQGRGVTLGKGTAKCGYYAVGWFSHSCLVILLPDLGDLEAVLGAHSQGKVQMQRGPTRISFWDHPGV